ncbi:MAG: hypothetical protein ACYDAB_03050 [bacterium]
MTTPTVFTGVLQFSGDVLTGTLASTVSMTDFGFNLPSLTMLQTENKATLELQFSAHPVTG